MEYDYIIIGAGPSGLTASYYLGKLGKKVLLIDKNNSIGGCHRVMRVNGLFSEHSPRFYSNSYSNFKNLLLNFGTSFETLFTPMKFNSYSVFKNSIFNLKIRELILFTVDFIKLIVNKNHGKNTTMETYVLNNHFNKNSIKFINNVCRLTDGADITRYTLSQFLQIANQQLIHTLYQPKEPTDTKLFNIWLDNIINTNNVNIKLNTEIQKINFNNNTITNIEINNTIVSAKNYILALPPVALENILNNSNISNAFLSSNFNTWVNQNKYDNHISICFHWNTKINLQNIWMIPKSDWGLAYIVLSDYMYFNDSRSITVISITLTNTTSKSSITNKIASKSSKEEIINEAFRQLKETFINLPEPTFIIFNPKLKFINGKWIEDDSAFINTVGNSFIKSKSWCFNNLYNLGTQNGNSTYHFTSIESAISNAISLVHTLEPETKKTIPLLETDTLIDIIKFLFIVMFILEIFR